MDNRAVPGGGATSRAAPPPGARRPGRDARATFPADTGRHIPRTAGRFYTQTLPVHRPRLAELLSRVPVGDYITAAEAWGILGMSRQAFHQNSRIRRGFIYSVPRGPGGERLYHRGSVEQFRKTGDGRFPLVQACLTQDCPKDILCAASTR